MYCMRCTLSCTFLASFITVALREYNLRSWISILKPNPPAFRALDTHDAGLGENEDDLTRGLETGNESMQ